MNAYVSKEQLDLLPPAQINFPQHHADAKAGKNGVVSSLFGRVAAFIERQRVMSELGALSDRELADIGLSRAELHNVFDPAMGRRR